MIPREVRHRAMLAVALVMGLAIALGALATAAAWYRTHPAPGWCYDRGRLLGTDYCLNAHYGKDWDDD